MAVVCEPTLDQINTGTGMNWTYSSLISSTSTSGLALGFYAGSPTYSIAVYMPTIGIATGGSTNHATQSADYTGGCAVITWVIGTSGDSTTDHVAINGIESSSYTVGPGTSGAGMGNGTLQIGGAGWVSGIGFAGTLASLWVWNKPLSMSSTNSGQQSEVLSAALMARRDAEARGVIFHPQFGNNIGDHVICLGDSLTYGSASSNPPTTGFCSTTNMSSLVNSPALKNLGNPGGVMMDFGARGLYEGAYYLSRNGRNTAFVWGCTNDSSYGYNYSAAACWKYTEGLLIRLRAEAVKTIVITMISATGRDTAKDNLNPLINAGWSQVADGEANFASDPNYGADGAYSNATYFNSDHIHLTNLGYSQVAAYAQNSYNYLWGATQQNPTSISTTYSLTAADGWSVFSTNGLTATLPNCLGYGAGYQWHTRTSTAGTDTLKTATSSQTIDGTDYSSSGLTLASNTANAFAVVSGAVASGGCTWTQVQ
jgi:lysophospholipase L1-like esterase